MKSSLTLTRFLHLLGPRYHWVSCDRYAEPPRIIALRNNRPIWYNKPEPPSEQSEYWKQRWYCDWDGNRWYNQDYLDHLYEDQWPDIPPALFRRAVRKGFLILGKDGMYHPLHTMLQQEDKDRYNKRRLLRNNHPTPVLSKYRRAKKRQEGRDAYHVWLRTHNRPTEPEPKPQPSLVRKRAGVIQHGYNRAQSVTEWRREMAED